MGDDGGYGDNNGGGWGSNNNYGGNNNYADDYNNYNGYNNDVNDFTNKYSSYNDTKNDDSRGYTKYEPSSKYEDSTKSYETPSKIYEEPTRTYDESRTNIEETRPEPSTVAPPLPVSPVPESHSYHRETEEKEPEAKSSILDALIGGDDDDDDDDLKFKKDTPNENITVTTAEINTPPGATCDQKTLALLLGSVSCLYCYLRPAETRHFVAVSYFLP